MSMSFFKSKSKASKRQSTPAENQKDSKDDKRISDFSEDMKKAFNQRATKPISPLVGANGTLAKSTSVETHAVVKNNAGTGESFSIRLRLPRGEQLLVRCTATQTVSQYLAEGMTKIRDYLSPYASIDTVSLMTEEQTALQPSEVLSETPYIKSCIADGSIPVLILQDSSAATLLTKSPSSNHANSGGNDQQQQSSTPSSNGNGVTLTTHPLGNPAIPKDHATNPSAGAKPAFFELAKAAAMKQLREFPVQFLLPGGQTLVLKCASDSTIASIKEEIKEKSSRINLKPMSHYVLKTPSASAEGYLQDETVTMGSIPFIEHCRKQSTTPKLILVEKSAALTKKEKLINVEIGALIGSPLCWTQEDSESTQFRKSMTWVRYQHQKGRTMSESVMDSGSNSPTSDSNAAHNNTSSAVTSNSTGVVVDPNLKIFIKLRLPLLEATLEKSVKALGDETANVFVEKMFDKYYKNKTQNKKASDFVLKVSGFADFLTGDVKLMQFEYIRSCVAKKQQPQLSLVENETEELKFQELYVEDLPDEELLDDPKIVYRHEDIKSDALPWDQLTCISIWEITRNFRVRVIGVENIKRLDPEYPQLYIAAGLYHGGELLSPLMTTQTTPLSPNPRWYEWTNTSIQMCNIPRSTRICFTLFGSKKEESGVNSDKDVPLGWVAVQLFNYKHELRTGVMSLNMWPDDRANPIGTCVGNTSDSSAPSLFIEFDSYPLPVVFPTELMVVSPNPLTNSSSNNPNSNSSNSLEDLKRSMASAASGPTGRRSVNVDMDVQQRIEYLINTDPLYPITDADKQLLWNEREFCKTRTNSLPKLLMSVPFHDRFAVQIIQRMLQDWPPINAVDSLELLDSRFADSRVREYAVKCLEQLTDDELSSYLLQLVQVLKYEPYHDSALARFLLRRGLENRPIGHALFWYLKGEMHVQEISERYGLLLEAYLRGCGTHRLELKKQNVIVKDLVRIANNIKPLKDTERLDALHTELRKISFPNKVQLPLNPLIEVSGIHVEKCKYMDSKKLPLWLIFENADSNGPNKYVIFKSGDDLRQDMLTLQLMRLMDKLWKNEGLDLAMNPYGCISTGDEQGMIEVVLNSETMAKITKNAGGATAAFKQDPLANWLLKHNNNEQKYAVAVDNFVRSCAGYCIATYVLGIGDRHNDNVMITREGKMFHIDFGHFLGNYKKKFGIKRERAPFIFTPDFAYVMGGKDSKDFMKFVDLCCRAYNILRKNANVFINLFAMMLSTGIPELTCADDIEYLRDAFSLESSDEKAAEKLRNLIYKSLTTLTTQVNNAIHILAH